MDLADLKLKSLGIDRNAFGRICTFVDYGNVNYWYKKDERDWTDRILGPDERLVIDIPKLATFLDLFSTKKRFYYGWNQRDPRSQHLIVRAQACGFVKVAKPLQFIKHYLDGHEGAEVTGRGIKDGVGGKYVEIPKANFDVEISVDSVRLMDEYDTFCLMSGDSDFANLARFLKRKGKRVIVMASGQVFHSLKDIADCYVNAQRIKGDIASIKQRRPLRGGVSISDPSQTDKAA